MAIDDNGRETAADRTLIVELADQPLDRLGHRVRRCRARRIHPVPVAEQFTGCDVNQRRLDAGTAHIDAKDCPHRSKVSQRPDLNRNCSSLYTAWTAPYIVVSATVRAPWNESAYQSSMGELPDIQLHSTSVMNQV